MADYTDPGLAIKKLASNVKTKMTQKADASALASKADASALTGKLDKPDGKTGQLVYNATTNTWEAATNEGGAAAPSTIDVLI